jgi:biopolymer transport protein ExbB
MLAYIIELSIKSGGLLPLMMLLLLVSLIIIVERLYYFSRVIQVGDAMEYAVQKVRYGDRKALQQVADNYASAPQAVVLATALNSRSDSAEVMDRHIEESMLWQLPKLDRLLWVLDTAVTLAPLLGLFGTIIGMIETFDVLGDSNNANAVTGSIGHALIATGAGLFIAIITVVFLNYFNKRVRLAMHQMELLKVTVINRLHGGGVAGDIYSLVPNAPRPVSDQPQTAFS